MARTTRTDWLDEGLRLLREGGEGAITIERLCERLNRTKGAYYHHFRDVSAYLDALLEHWVAKHTYAPIAAAETGQDAHERRQRLEESVRKLDMKLERAVRAWALRDERAARVLRNVDARRIDYLAGLHATARTKGPRARVLAQLEYAAFVGAQQIFPSLSAHQARAVEAALNRALELLAKD
jgi:AcrR family transcriptional regulator